MPCWSVIFNGLRTRLIAGIDVSLPVVAVVVVVLDVEAVVDDAEVNAVEGFKDGLVSEKDPPLDVRPLLLPLLPRPVAPLLVLLVL